MCSDSIKKQSETFYHEGLSKKMAENFVEANDYFNKSIELDSNFIGPLLERAVCRQSLEDVSGALEDFKRTRGHTVT